MNSSADLLKQLRIDRSAPPPQSRRGLWIALAIAAAVLVLGLLGWAAFGRDKAIEVQTADVVAIGNGGGGASVLDATGYVVARRMATVSAKITGKVREVLIEEGQHVEAGQVMATLDPVDADAQRDLAAAQLGAARSQAGGVQAQLREAEANAARYGALVKQQLISKAQYDQAIAQRDSLRAQLLTAQRNAQVASDQLRIAGHGVDNTVVRAPFAGVVIAKAAQPGEIISPLSAGGGFTRTGIGTIVDMDSLEVEVDVGEAFIGRVQPKMPTEATLNAYPDWKIP
ncbi:MAG: efflux RND transporter periplasmic adaptor subunit, partial [Luteimonas sp.]